MLCVSQRKQTLLGAKQGAKILDTNTADTGLMKQLQDAHRPHHIKRDNTTHACTHKHTYTNTKELWEGMKNSPVL